MDATAITEAIAAGQLDGNLEPIMEAIVTRINDGAVGIYWRIRYDGDEWTRETVTLGELAWAQRYAAGGLRELTPTLRHHDVIALIAARFHEVKGMTELEAVTAVKAIRVSDVEVSEYEVVRPPKGDPA